MKTIEIPLTIKKELEIVGDGMSPNKTLKELLKNADNIPEDDDNYDKVINIGIDSETLQGLRDARLYATETYASVIYRLLQNHQK